MVPSVKNENLRNVLFHIIHFKFIFVKIFNRLPSQKEASHVDKFEIIVLKFRKKIYLSLTSRGFNREVEKSQDGECL